MFAFVATATWSVRSQRLECHATSKKALRKQGPVPTSRGRSRLRYAEQAPLAAPVTGPLSLVEQFRGQRWEWDSTCCLWPSPETVARESLAVLTLRSATAQ